MAMVMVMVGVIDMICGSMWSGGRMGSRLRNTSRWRTSRTLRRTGLVIKVFRRMTSGRMSARNMSNSFGVEPLWVPDSNRDWACAVCEGRRIGLRWERLDDDGDLIRLSGKSGCYSLRNPEIVLWGIGSGWRGVN